MTPVREVSWADFLLADILTSLAKPISDSERAVCHLLTGPPMDPSDRVRV
jgi:EXS family